MNSCTLQEILLFAFLLGIRGENLTYSHVCLSSCACKGIYTRSFQLESLHSQASCFPCFQSSKIQQNAFSKMSNYSLKQMSPESTLNWLQACCFLVVPIFCEEGQTRWISWALITCRKVQMTLVWIQAKNSVDQNVLIIFWYLMVWLLF